MAAMFGGGATPFVPPRDLHAMGFTQTACPMALMQRITGLLEQTLASLRLYVTGGMDGIAHANLLSPKGFRAAAAMAAWNAIEVGEVNAVAQQAQPATLF